MRTLCFLVQILVMHRNLGTRADKDAYQAVRIARALAKPDAQQAFPADGPLRGLPSLRGRRYGARERTWLRLLRSAPQKNNPVVSFWNRTFGIASKNS